MNRQNPIQILIKCLSRLPGIGEKTATRLALYIMNCPKEDAMELAQSIMDARQKVHFCRQCFNYTENDLCFICANPNRDSSALCIVETPADLMSIERTGMFRGGYHILHGVISPLDGIGPDQLRIKGLLQRIKECNIKEIILATNPTINGNATAVYISDQLTTSCIKITRIAQGIPPGGDIGYADQLTLKNALEGLREMKR